MIRSQSRSQMQTVQEQLTAKRVDSVEEEDHGDEAIRCSVGR
jgi:hypothetical protein